MLISNSVLILNGVTWYKLNFVSDSASFRKPISHWLSNYRLAVIIKQRMTNEVVYTAPAITMVISRNDGIRRVPEVAFRVRYLIFEARL